MPMSEIISTRVPDYLNQSLEKYCLKYNKHKGTIIREAVEAYLASANKEGHVCHACDGTGICD